MYILSSSTGIYNISSNINCLKSGNFNYMIKYNNRIFIYDTIENAIFSFIYKDTIITDWKYELSIKNIIGITIIEDDNIIYLLPIIKASKILTLYCIDNISIKKEIIIDISGNIEWLIQQDGFYYILSSNNNESYINILTPDFRNIGQVKLPNIIHKFLMIGFHCVYTLNNKLIYFDLIHKEIYKTLEYYTDENYISTSFIIYLNNLYIFSSKKGILIVNYPNYEELVFDNTINTIIDTDKDSFNDALSSLTKSYVKTDLYNNIKPELSIFSRIILEIYSILHTFEQKELNDYITKLNLYSPFPFITKEIYKTMIIASKPKDFFYPKSQIFNNHNCCQLYLNAMSTITNLPFVKEILAKYNIIDTSSIDNEYFIPGLFHTCWPKNGMGWHHNIDNVDFKKSTAYYFVCVDKDDYGGSFFLYKHPISGHIHAIPDIHGSMKTFIIVSDIENPFWHSIISLTNKRLSLGISPMSDNNLSKRNIIF